MRRQQRRTAKIINREAVHRLNLEWMIKFNTDLRRKVHELHEEIDYIRRRDLKATIDRAKDE